LLRPLDRVFVAAAGITGVDDAHVAGGARDAGMDLLRWSVLGEGDHGGGDNCAAGEGANGDDPGFRKAANYSCLHEFHYLEAVLTSGQCSWTDMDIDNVLEPAFTVPTMRIHKRHLPLFLLGCRTEDIVVIRNHCSPIRNVGQLRS
jgi:hypothetical protein